MKIDVYSIMRDEIAILPYFLRHYETFADRIFVWDDGSDDGTREILEAHPKVKLLPCNMDGADDVYYVKYLWNQYEEISRGHADWVICVDADEFVYHPDIIQRINELTKRGDKRVRLDGYTMYHPIFPITTGQIYDEIKVGWPDMWSRKTVLFTPDMHMTWKPGRHNCVSNRHVPTIMDSGINLLHFRYLGPEYFLERNRKNCGSMKVAFKEGQRHNLPDGSRGIPYVWYEENKNKVIRLIK
jgi:glycosyltransferase involved in cell wall biosynthesis